MSDVANKLRLIMEGGLLLEAPEDKYDLPSGGSDKAPPIPKDDTATDDTNKGGDTTNTDGNENTDDNKSTDPTDPSTSDDNAGTDDDAGGNYDLDDDSSDDDSGTDDAPITSDTGDADTTGTEDTAATPPAPKVGELLNIDPKARAILIYNNFERYRDLRDDTSRLISELSEFVPTNDDIRLVVNTTIEKGTDLVNKLTDYILYKYSDNSYEINYYNFMQFILEKRLLGELYANIIKSSSQVKKNK
jgi:hypothetical protein